MLPTLPTRDLLRPPLTAALLLPLPSTALLLLAILLLVASAGLDEIEAEEDDVGAASAAGGGCAALAGLDLAEEAAAGFIGLDLEETLPTAAEEDDEDDDDGRALSGLVDGVRARDDEKTAFVSLSASAALTSPPLPICCANGSDSGGNPPAAKLACSFVCWNLARRAARGSPDAS